MRMPRRIPISLHTHALFVGAWLFAACATSPSGPQPTQLLVVLPTTFVAHQPARGGSELVEESISNAIGAGLGKAGVTVLQRETTLALLTENGVAIDKVCEASCALDAARELKASYFIAVTVTKTNDGLVSFMRLYAARDGRVLASTSQPAGDLTSLAARLADASIAMIVEGLPGAKDGFTAEATERSRTLARFADESGGIRDTKTGILYLREFSGRISVEGARRFCRERRGRPAMHPEVAAVAEVYRWAPGRVQSLFRGFSTYDVLALTPDERADEDGASYPGNYFRGQTFYRCQGWAHVCDLKTGAVDCPVRCQNEDGVEEITGFAICVK